MSNKSISLENRNQDRLSVYYVEEFGIASISVTDSFGRMTNSFKFSKTSLKKLIKFLKELEQEKINVR